MTRKIFLFFCGVLLAACTIKPEGRITVVTKPVNDVTENSAVVGMEVSYTGGFTMGDCGFCYGESPNPTVKDKMVNVGYGVGEYSGKLGRLDSDTKYYIRAFANSSSGYQYGNQEEFRTKERWLYYGSGTFKSGWGLAKGGKDEWGVMFPPKYLRDYALNYVTSVDVYFKVKGEYTLNVYEGGKTAPETLLVTKNYTIQDTDQWHLLTNFTPVEVNQSKNLWITLSLTYEAGIYPKAASEGINEPNARWACTSGGKWHDTYDTNNYRDLCWMIKVRCTKSLTKGEDVVLDMNSLSNESTSEENNVADMSLYEDVQNISCYD